MKALRFILLFAILLTACIPLSAPTPAPASTPVPTNVPDELAIFRQGLVSANHNDLALLDHPTRYDLTLQYDPSGPTLSGTQDVLYFNRQAAPLNEIYFRLFANYPDSGGKFAISNLTIDGAASAFALQVQNTALQVPLAKPLAPGASLHAHLDFVVTIPRESKTHYADFTANDSIVTVPSVSPLIPAYDTAGWHIELPPAYGDLVYADVSLYVVTLTVPSQMTVIASGSTLDTRDNGNGTTTWRMAGAPMRDFDFNFTAQLQKVSATIGETTINSWYEANDADAGKQALQYATDAFKTYEKRFGAYPYRELDVIETPTTAGGIEYPGVIVVNRNIYQNTRERDTLAFVIAHEVSHQWWYALVGNDQVNFPWVDEALAQYSTLIYFEDVRGAAAGQSVLKNNFQAVYDRAKKASRDAVVNQPVSAFDEGSYSEMVYNKAPLFFDAIRKKMGDAVFFKFLQTFFERFRYRIVTPDDLLKTAEDVYGQSLKAEYQLWILSVAK
ncbi:Aminopeptidase N [Anaerolineae bacterium]|nr:Aminopeptidase N [Anaerolineae bacterium]